MQEDELVAQFRDQGYFVLPEAFSEAAITALRERIEPFVRRHQGELAARNETGISRAHEISFTMHLAGQDPIILTALRDSVVGEIGRALLGAEPRLYWDQAVYKLPETRRDFPWHQDNGYTPVDPAEYLTFWIALEEATIENGCIWVMPGSHRDGEQPHEMTEIGWQGYFGSDPGIPVPLPRGGMAVFSSLLLHKSGPNVSQGQRKAYIVQLTPAGARRRDTGAIIDGPPVG